MDIKWIMRINNKVIISYIANVFPHIFLKLGLGTVFEADIVSRSYIKTINYITRIILFHKF